MAVAGFIINLLALIGVFVQVGRILSRLDHAISLAQNAHNRIDSVLLGEET